MKKIFTVVAVAMGMVLPMQAQQNTFNLVNRTIEQIEGVKSIKKLPAADAAVQQEGDVYIYTKEEVDRNPRKVPADQLYMHTTSGDVLITPEATIQVTPLVGTYTAQATSLAYGTIETWDVVIKRDQNDHSKYWINPFMNLSVPGFPTNDVYAIMSMNSDGKTGTLTMPLGQSLSTFPPYDFLIAGMDTQYNPILTGNAVANFEITNEGTTITWDQNLGANDSFGGEWWQGLGNISFTLTGSEGIIQDALSINQVDSISVVTPSLKVTTHEQYGSLPYYNVYFNYDAATYATEDKSTIAGQGWFNKAVSYKAYDQNNNVVAQDYVDIYYVNGNEMMLYMLGFEEVNGNANYVIDGFVPCDTTLRIAFSIADDFILWNKDNSIAYKGVESYVDANGTAHGIVFDYYNERPKMRDNITVANDYRSVTIKFSKEVASYYSTGMAQVTYAVYRQDGSGKYNVVSTNTGFYLETNMRNSATVTLPSEVTVNEGDIVTISWNNWDVIDMSYCRAAPASMESSVDANGTPQGIYWVVEK